MASSWGCETEPRNPNPNARVGSGASRLATKAREALEVKVLASEQVLPSEQVQDRVPIQHEVQPVQHEPTVQHDGEQEEPEPG